MVNNMKYSLTNDAESDLHEILFYFSKKEKKLVKKFDEDFKSTCKMLSNMPGMASIITDDMQNTAPFLKGVRKWQMKIFKQYTIFYKIENDCKILIVRIVSSKRDLPNLFLKWDI